MNIVDLAQRDKDRLSGYTKLLDFYQGKHWEKRAVRGEKQLTFNYAKTLVDKTTNYLMASATIAVESAEDSDDAMARAQRAEQALRAVYEEAILGDACYKVIWDTEGKGIRITTPDVQGIYAWWLGDDVSQVWRVASKYTLTADEVGMLYKVKPKAKTSTMVEVWTNANFSPYLRKDKAF